MNKATPSREQIAKIEFLFAMSAFLLGHPWTVALPKPWMEKNIRKIERWQRIFFCSCLDTFGADHTEGRDKANLIIKDAFAPWSRKGHNGFISFQIAAAVAALCAKDVDSFIYPFLAPKQRIIWTHFHSTTCGLGRKFCQQEPGIDMDAEKLYAQAIETATRTLAKEAA